MLTPDLSMTEGFLASLGGTGDEDPLFRAQELVYDAWETPQKRARVALAEQALEISPLCADAYIILGQDKAKSPSDAIDWFTRAVEAGEQAIGKEAFEEDAGHFWGIFETRPYMRARHFLADVLWDMGERSRAIAHYQDMLRLNPNDNQGIRYVLANCLLLTEDHNVLEALLDKYKDDAMAAWAYSKTLLAYRRTGASDGSRKLLREAWGANHHVPAYLTGKKRLPKKSPDYIGWGDKNEAISYVQDCFEAWKATPGAVAWVAETVMDFPPPAT